MYNVQCIWIDAVEVYVTGKLLYNVGVVTGCEQTLAFLY